MKPKIDSPEYPNQTQAIPGSLLYCHAVRKTTHKPTLAPANMITQEQEVSELREEVKTLRAKF